MLFVFFFTAVKTIKNSQNISLILMLTQRPLSSIHTEIKKNSILVKRSEYEEKNVLKVKPCSQRWKSVF